MNQYILQQPIQPTACTELSPTGELVWNAVPMARWQQQMFPVRYTGDFSAQWLRLILLEKGIEI